MTVKHVFRTKLITIATIGLILAQTSTSQAADPLETTFREMAAKSRERFAYLRGPFHCEGVYKETFVDGTATESAVSFTRKGDFACFEQRFLDRESGKPTGRVWVFARGPRYSFFLEKKAGASAFVIEELINQPNAKLEGNFIYLTNFMTRICEKPYYAAGVMLPELVADKGFTLTSIKEDVAGDRRIVTMDYQLKQGEKGVQKGFIRFDSNLDWAITSYEVTIPYTMQNITRESIYGGSNKYKLIGGKYVFESYREDSRNRLKPEETHEWHLKKANFDPIDDAVFSLKAYGLPEPEPGKPAAIRD